MTSIMKHPEYSDERIQRNLQGYTRLASLAAANEDYAAFELWVEQFERWQHRANGTDVASEMARCLRDAKVEREHEYYTDDFKPRDQGRHDHRSVGDFWASIEGRHDHYSSIAFWARIEL